MDTKEKLIKDFVNSIRYAPTYKSHDDFTKMTEAFVEELETMPHSVFGVYDMAADSMIESPRLLSIHATLESADKTIPDNLRHYDRETTGDFVKNYVYMAIREIKVLAR